jgi:hypothetical protein
MENSNRLGILVNWRSYCCCGHFDETLTVVQADRRIGVLRKSALVEIAIFEFRFVEATRRSIIISSLQCFRLYPQGTTD